jgi:hypothetical protein
LPEREIHDRQWTQDRDSRLILDGVDGLAVIDGWVGIG